MYKLLFSLLFSLLSTVRCKGVRPSSYVLPCEFMHPLCKS